MKKSSHVTAFYIETLLLIVVFIGVILILTGIFGLGRAQGAAAKELNNAVCLAQNAAEAVSASKSAEELLSILNENSNASLMPDGTGVSAFYGKNMEPDENGLYRVDVSWIDDGSGLIRSVIEVRCGEEAETVYSLETAVFIKGAAA